MMRSDYDVGLRHNTMIKDDYNVKYDEARLLHI
jgi:hypothetical protein